MIVRLSIRYLYRSLPKGFYLAQITKLLGLHLGSSKQYSQDLDAVTFIELSVIVNLYYLLNTDRCSPRLKDVVVREFGQLWDVLSNVEAMRISFLAESNRAVDSIILKEKESENLKTPFVDPLYKICIRFKTE